jgi:hypothetical protein
MTEGCVHFFSTQIEYLTGLLFYLFSENVFLKNSRLHKPLEILPYQKKIVALKKSIYPLYYSPIL